MPKLVRLPESITKALDTFHNAIAFDDDPLRGRAVAERAFLDALNANRDEKLARIAARLAPNDEDPICDPGTCTQPQCRIAADILRIIAE